LPIARSPERHDLLQTGAIVTGIAEGPFGRLALVCEYLGAEIGEQHNRDDEQADPAEHEQALGGRC